MNWFGFLKYLEGAPGKSEPLKSSNVLGLHFEYLQSIEAYYKNRENPASREKAIEACRQQINIASAAVKALKEENLWPVTHKGYEQLAIIFEKSAQFQEAIDLCFQAKDQGWSGNWDKRIERCEMKMKKIRE